MVESLNKNVKEKLAKLKVQQTFLTKSCKASVNAFKLSNPTLLTELSGLDNQLQAQRNEETSILQIKIVEIFEKLQEAKTEFGNSEKSKNYHAENCRESLLLIQKKIKTLREELEKRNYLLNEEQKNLHSDVILAQCRLEEGSHAERAMSLESAVSSKVRTTSKHQAQHKYQDITIFEKFIEKNGGTTGGWEQSDHLLFLRLRRRHFRGRDVFFAAVQAQLPDLSLEIIEEHETWYQGFEDLKDKHKNALEAWKADKKMSEMRRRASQDIERKLSINSESIENSKVKAEIEEWRKQRQLREEAIAKAEREKREAEEMKRAMKSKKKARLRAAVLAFREQKVQERQERLKQEERKKQEEREEKAAQAKKLIRSFRKLDKLYLEKKKSQRDRSSVTSSVLPKVAMSVEVPRDPIRVLKPTKVWQAHCTTKQNSLKPIIHLRNMPHLAVPEWRRGLV